MEVMVEIQIGDEKTIAQVVAVSDDDIRLMTASQAKQYIDSWVASQVRISWTHQYQSPTLPYQMLTACTQDSTR